MSIAGSRGPNANSLYDSGEMRRLCLLAFPLLAFGCHHPDPIVGTWTSSAPVGELPAERNVTFGEDGKFVSITTIGGGGHSITATDRGTYRLEGTKLNQHMDDADWAFEGPGLEKAKARFAKNKAKIIQSANAEPSDTLHWNGNDAFTLTDSKGKASEWKRKR